MTESPKYNYKQFINMMGVDKYTGAYMKKKFSITDTKTQKDWCSTLLKLEAIDKEQYNTFIQKIKAQ